MADPHAKPTSPISQVLQSLGLTREDLLRHSDQMRQFLTAEDANSLRVLTKEISEPGSTSFASGSRARAGSTTSRSNASPPRTPVKSEPAEPTSMRHMDSMEMVIERKSRQHKRDRKGRKERSHHREREVVVVPPSPSPSTSAGFSLDSFMYSRDSHRITPSEVPEEQKNEVVEDDVLPTTVPPVTPQHLKYYRDYTVNDTSTTRPPPQDIFSPNPNPPPSSPTPARYRSRHGSIVTSKTPAKLPQTPATFAIPQTPKRVNNYYKSPLPASSPPPVSSPFSSPAKCMINLVSSPGPMGPLPSESDYDELPYTLPPGPYTSRKPDVSYAALVGRAILSSPKHALTLQEIYDYITIVHSYFKRGEPTWMNSIRHVLSTTVVFRKIVRERREGRTLWGIWDEDLGCFDNGGFDKTKCREFVEGRKNGAPGSGSGSGRKRAADGDGERKPKRQRKSAIAAVEKEAVEAALRMQSTIPPVGGQQHSTSVFMLTKPTPHHQPYYETCVQQQPPHPPPAPVNLPAEVIFPPLPRMASNSSSYSEGYASTSASEPPSSAWDSEPPRSISPPAPSCSAASGNGSVSMPDLTPNGSSSSPPSASELEQELEMELELAYPEIDIDVAENGDMDDDERLFSEMLSADALEPGFTLNKHDFYEYERERGRMKGGTPPLKKAPLPPSPSLNRKPKNKTNTNTNTSKITPSKDVRLPLFPTTTTSPTMRPSTPPRNTSSMSHLQLSPVRTPLSHKGLHMSPSASLAHYKSHLDPPPPVGGSPGDLDSENMRTPSRKRTSSNLNPAHSIFPVTPKKLVFPAPTSTSHGYSGASQDSPFRTPGSRHSIFDPHDPGALLDDELSRLGGGDSPASGLYEGRRGLLYESPSMPSPGKWTRWW